MAPITITVLYPNEPSTTFNMDYYLSTHMPLVQRLWKSHGLTNWRITKFNGTADPGVKAPHSVEAKLEVESLEAFQKAGEAEGETVFGDIPNFTNSKLVILVGEVMKSM